MALLERFTSVSKPTFLATRVIPANPNDAHYDDRCTFCWDQYNDEHQDVRVLPCNHVFGANCLQTMVNSDNGHLCPLCRCMLFRPSWKVVISELLKTLLTPVMLQLQALYWKVMAFYNTSPPMMQQLMRISEGVFWFKVYHRDPYNWASIIVRRYTDLEMQVPSLNLSRPQLALSTLRLNIYLPVCCYLRYNAETSWVPTATTCLIDLGIALGVVLYARCTGLDGVCLCRRESGTLSLMMLVSMLIAHMPTFCILWYIHHQQDLWWLLVAAYKKSPVLAHAMAAVFGAFAY